MLSLNLHPIVWLVFSAVCFAGGEYLSKSYVIYPRAITLVGLVALYLTGVLFWLPALKQKPDLAVTGTMWSVITLLVTVAIGTLVFGEVLSGYQVVGIILAVGSVIFLSI
jgi:multidrug transporter EmrE-like cation transporter